MTNIILKITILIICVNHLLSMKERIESNKNRKRKRHDSQMPRIKTLKNTHTKKFTPYKRDNKWAQFYGSKAWQNLRSEKLMNQPLCECCLYHDKITPATQVHHIHRFGLAENETEMYSRFLDYDNLMSLCSSCHRRIHAGQEKNTIDHIWVI